MKARKKPSKREQRILDRVKSRPELDPSTVDVKSTRTVTKDESGKTSTEYVSDATIEDAGGKSRRIVKNKDGKSTSYYARRRKPTSPVKVGPSRPGTTMANMNGRGYSEIEKEVRPGISDARSLDDLERVKRMIR